MKILLFVLLLVSFGFSQNTVKTIINYSEVVAFNSVLDTIEYSPGFVTNGREGTCTAFFDIDTTGVIEKDANKADSCLVVGFQTYEKSIGWSTYYNNRSMFKGNAYTLIDTVDRALFAGQNIKMLISYESTEWCPGDSTRLVFFHGFGDSTNLEVKIRIQ